MQFHQHTWQLFLRYIDDVHNGYGITKCPRHRLKSKAAQLLSTVFQNSPHYSAKEAFYRHAAQLLAHYREQQQSTIHQRIQEEAACGICTPQSLQHILWERFLACLIQAGIDENQEIIELTQLLDQLYDTRKRKSVTGHSGLTPMSRWEQININFATACQDPFALLEVYTTLCQQENVTPVKKWIHNVLMQLAHLHIASYCDIKAYLRSGAQQGKLNPDHFILIPEAHTDTAQQDTQKWPLLAFHPSLYETATFELTKQFSDLADIQENHTSYGIHHTERTHIWCPAIHVKTTWQTNAGMILGIAEYITEAYFLIISDIIFSQKSSH